MSNRYHRSEGYLSEVEKIIPLGSQTYSKSKVHLPFGVSPYFIQRGKGCRVWDLDGNEYLDFMSALLAVSLGYQDPDVDDAIKKQLQSGIIFSLSHPIEKELADIIIEMVPCAEMVRFGKNGSDATSGAVRLARAYTQRDHIATCGYHGCQDWYIGCTDRNRGVPEAVRGLTHRFTYNDISSLEKIFSAYPQQVAAVILEPMTTQFPKDHFLEKVKQMAHQQGAVLIFDEIITGFRFARGGAQEYFKVIPDLATFGKGMANGLPFSAIVGRKDIMNLFNEVDLFFSLTFGGETVTLAAAVATLKKMQRESVIETIIQRGEYLIERVSHLIKQHQVESFLSIVGHPAWTFLIIHEVAPYSYWELKTFFLQEMLRRGVLMPGTHNLNYAHTLADIDQLMAAYHEVFPLMKEAIQTKTLKERIEGQILRPMYRVRT